MNAGLPGSGIGGIFYIFSALIMIAREMVRWILGFESDSSRRNLVLAQAVLMSGILAAIYIAERIADFFNHVFVSLGVEPISTGFSSTSVAIIPFILLGGVLSMTQVLRFFFAKDNK